jgi:hypothetical protein
MYWTILGTKPPGIPPRLRFRSVLETLEQLGRELRVTQERAREKPRRIALEQKVEPAFD